MSNQFELALRKYIAAFDGTKDISTAEFKFRFDNLHHKYFNFVPRSKGLLTLTLTREEVFEIEAARLANGTKVTLVHFRKVSLDCVDIMLRLGLVSGKEETTVRVVTVITANQAVASREIEDSFQLEVVNIEVEPQDEASQLPKLLNMIKNREWDLLSSALTPETLRAAAEEDDLNLSENVGSLLHFALRFDAPSSIIYQITHGMHSSMLHRDAKDRLPLHIAVSKARPSIISHLLSLNPIACTCKDSKGKLPLHRCFDNKVVQAFKPQQFTRIVEMLVQTSPETIMIEDHKKRCPIELAILSTAPMQTIVLMHHKKDYVRKNSSPTTAAC
mmetsp:Transcript_17850/g.27115  ORF Transcript_17850/g.27115 Transcript_17850/m.27115 type:complete len:331 (+) Transcript_17850:74-1066(+)